MDDDSDVSLSLWLTLTFLTNKVLHCLSSSSRCPKGRGSRSWACLSRSRSPRCRESLRPIGKKPVSLNLQDLKFRSETVQKRKRRRKRRFRAVVSLIGQSAVGFGGFGFLFQLDTTMKVITAQADLVGRVRASKEKRQGGTIESF